jgi:hypothetical protein
LGACVTPPAREIVIVETPSTIVRVIDAVEVSKLPEVGVSTATNVSDPVEFGLGRVHVPVVEEIEIAVQAEIPNPPELKSTEPGTEVVIFKTGEAPTGVEVPPPCNVTVIVELALPIIIVSCLTPTAEAPSVALTV